MGVKKIQWLEAIFCHPIFLLSLHIKMVCSILSTYARVFGAIGSLLFRSITPQLRPMRSDQAV